MDFHVGQKCVPKAMSLHCVPKARLPTILGWKLRFLQDQQPLGIQYDRLELSKSKLL